MFVLFAVKNQSTIKLLQIFDFSFIYNSQYYIYNIVFKLYHTTARKVYCKRNNYFSMFYEQYKSFLIEETRKLFLHHTYMYLYNVKYTFLFTIYS